MPRGYSRRNQHRPRRNYRACAHLIPSGPGETETQFFGVDQRKWAQFMKVLDTERVSPMTVTFQGPQRPVLIEIGASFVGVLMPVRGRRPFEHPAWFDAAACLASGDGQPPP
jgi:hypothetical protein